MKLTFITFFILISATVFSQADLLKSNGSKYYYKGKMYKIKELGPIFNQSEKALKFYKRGKLYNKVSTYTAAIGMVTIGIGIGFAANNDWPKATATFAATVILGLVSLIPRVMGDKEMEKAKDAFNIDMIQRHGYNFEPTLTLVDTKNGVGLVYQF